MPSYARLMNYGNINREPMPDGRLLLRGEVYYVNPAIAVGDFGYARIMEPEIVLDPMAPETNQPVIKAAIIAHGQANGYPDLVQANVYVPAYAVGGEVDVALGFGVISDWNPGGVGDVVLIRIASMSEPVTQIDGLVGGYPGRIYFIKNDALGIVQLPNFLYGSAAINQFSAFDPPVSIPPGFNAEMYYSGMESKWKSLRRLVFAAGLPYEFQFGLSNGFHSISEVPGTPMVYVPATDSTTLGGLIPSRRFQECRGAAIASASTLTLGTDGNQFPITAGPPIDYITKDGWQDGSRVALELPVTFPANAVNNLSGAPPAGTAPLKLRALAALVTSNAYLLELRLDGTNWVQPG